MSQGIQILKLMKFLFSYFKFNVCPLLVAFIQFSTKLCGIQELIPADVGFTILFEIEVQLLQEDKIVMHQGKQAVIMCTIGLFIVLLNKNQEKKATLKRNVYI